MQFYDPVSKIIKPDLNADVDAWLAKGHQITELPFGHSNFKDGNIPQAKSTIKPLDIEKYNAERVTKPKPVKAPKKDKPTKVRTVKSCVHKSKVMKQKRATKLVVYSERSMIYMHNCEVFKHARLNKLTEFEGLCIRHGYTIFKAQKSMRFRCVECLVEYNQNNVNDYKRRVLNKELMEVAVQTQQKKFLGVCLTHGETNFAISKTNSTISKLSYKCCKCMSNTSKKFKNKGKTS